MPNYFASFSLVDGTEPMEQVPDGYYLTRAVNRRSVQSIWRLAAQEDPFFVYVAHATPHWPLHALEEDIAKCEGYYTDGWDWLREERSQPLRNLAVRGCARRRTTR